MALNTQDQNDLHEKNHHYQLGLLFVVIIAFFIVAVFNKVIGLFFLSAGIWGPALVVYWLVRVAMMPDDDEDTAYRYNKKRANKTKQR